MKWNVYYYNINNDKIEVFNIFDHWRFSEDILKRLKKIKDKDAFAEGLKRDLMYYFWSKAEWELIIEITEDNRILLSPWVGCRNPEEVKIDMTNDNSFDWKGFAEKHIKKQIYKNEAKIDVYEQVVHQWGRFVEYCWENMRNKKKGRK